MAHDVLVVGGGHNGLVAACFLARSGLRIGVLEKEERLGGMTLSAPLIPGAPEHVVNPGAYENVYLRAGGVVEELGLARFGYRELDSAGWAWLGPGGESLHFQRSVDDTAREIARFSSTDARAYRELTEVALQALEIQSAYGASQPGRPSRRTLALATRGLARSRSLRSRMAALLTGTAADAIASTFESEQVRGAFASIATILGAPTAEGSAIALLGPSALHHRGAARPVGGMGGLVAALEACLNASGGDTRTGARVDAVRRGRTGGWEVELESGEVLEAGRAILTAIPPQRIPDLVEPGSLGAVGERLRAAPANAGGVATFTVNLALSGRLELPEHQPQRPGTDLRRPALFTGGFDEVLEACALATRGELAPRMPWWAAIFNAMDPGQAPDGQDTAQCYGPVPVHVDGGWAARRDETAEHLLGQVAQALPGIREHELGRLVESPEDLSARTGTVNGCLYHVDHLPTRLGPLRPALGAGGYRTPVRGLYLTGAGSHPSGGVSGLPGRLAAQAILRDLHQ